MLNNFKKHLVLLFPLILLVLLYFFSRLFHLTIIPVFCDEAIYIRWAQIMRAVQSLRFIPLSDGKQPFFMWLVIPFLKIFANPLAAGRMVSVMAGFGSVIGAGLLSYLLFKKKEVSIFTSLLYIMVPFTLFFDRMALADGLLSMFGIWCLVFFVLLVRTARLDVAMISGILLGLALITKSPALFFAIMLPITILLQSPARMILANLQGSSLQKSLLKSIALMMIVYLFAFAIYNILRLGPEFQMIAIRNKDYVFSFSEILNHPFNPLIGHLKDIVNWYWILGTPLILISGLIGMFLVLKKNFRVGLLLLAWFFLPVVGQSVIAKVYTSRYILFTVPIFLIFSGVAIEEFFQKTKNKLVVIFGLVIIFLWPMYQSFLLISDPQRAWLPKNERQGYLEMWTSGYGIMEASDYLKGVSKTQKVLVGTEGYFGTLPDGLQMYLEKVPNITIIGVGQPVLEISPKLLDGLKENKVFLLVNDSRLKINNDQRLKLINKYPKAVNSQGFQENLLLLEVLQ